MLNTQTNPASQTAPAQPYQAEQYQAIPQRLGDAFKSATQAKDVSSELVAIKDLRQLLKDFDAAIVVREKEIAEQAREADTIAKMLQAIQSGASLAQIQAIPKEAGPTKPRTNYNGPKVYKYLLKEEFNGGKVDFKKGHNGVLKGVPKAGDNWHYKTADKKPDMAYYRDTTPSELAAMQAAVDDWEAKQAKKP